MSSKVRPKNGLAAALRQEIADKFLSPEAINRAYLTEPSGHNVAVIS
jgi:hypothetical protein